MLTHNTCMKASIVTCEDEVVISVNGAPQRAQLALAAPVVLEVGDAVLCLCDEAGVYYIIAPISDGKTWRVRADTINIEAKNLALTGDRLELTARILFEKTVDAYRWTSNLLQWCCGRQRTLIDGQQQTRAGRIDIHAQGDVRIDGEHINLG